MKLSNKEFNELLKELSNTPLANQDEIDFRANIEKEFRYVQKNISKTLLGSELIHYSTRNEKLNKIINKLTGRDTTDIIALHTIESHPPSETKPHVDLRSTCTLNILLKDEFEGGEFYLNEELYDGLRKKGDYIVYNGGKELHSVSTITSGVRKSLIVWYGKLAKNII
jgi:predicted 2-oxoglutarate/Fe(II)-dependent dioxygenase YbiX